MQPHVVCGFPGVGKSRMFRSIQNQLYHTKSIPDDTVIDLDTNGYRGDPTFPVNYIRMLKCHLSTARIIFAATEMPIIQQLINQEIFHYRVYPHPSLLDDYLIRYIDRGDSFSSVRYFQKQWGVLIRELRSIEDSYSHPVELLWNETVEDRFHFDGINLRLR